MPNSAGPVSERKYRVIASDLRAAMARGEYPAQARLPGENDLMQQYQVARMTARQALAQLINEGLAVARKGSGVYVREFRPVIRAGVGRLAGRGWGSGRSIWSADIDDRELVVDQLEVRRAEPPEHIRLLLDLPDDPEVRVIARSRRYVLDGKPVLLAVSYLPAQIAAGTMMEYQDAGPGGIYARLRELGPRAGPVSRGPALPDARARGVRAAGAAAGHAGHGHRAHALTPRTGRSWRSTR